jgi:hypothetical protein
MWLTDEEQKALLESTGRITEKISRAVQHAIQAIGLGALPAEVERIHRLAEHFDKRQERLIKAQLRAAAAQAATFKANIDTDKE